MWKLFREELCKIASRKIVWISLFFLLAFVRYRLGTVQDEYSVTVNGKNIYGKEAIAIDQELTAQYAGPLTRQTVKKIYDRYGFFYCDVDTGERKGNFCSRFITQQMTNINQVGEENLEEIQFFQGEEWEMNVAPLLKGNLRFDYVSGWTDLKETYGMVVIWGLSILFIIGLSPVFSEEYTLRTADILLTTRRGKKSGIWIKMAAAFSFTLVTFLAVTFYVWAIYLKVFGTQGLDASPILIGAGLPYRGYSPDTIQGFFLIQFAAGLAGYLLLTALVLAASALCKNAFLTAVISLAAFLFPIVWVKALGPMWILGITMTKAVTRFMVSMPAYLSLYWGFAFTEKQIAWNMVIALATGGVSVVLGYRGYRNYQG